MRVVNQSLETITQYDLTAGRLIPAMAIQENPAPIDNVTKFAWADDDWEPVQMYIPNPIPTAAEQIALLKNKLRDSDYHILKIVEGAATIAECGEIIRRRVQWRKEINELEETL